MEEPVKTGECDVEMVVPQKKKTLKQARLPFQMLSSVDSPNTNKKRKLISPTPVECKSPKLVKITTKENAFDTATPKEPEVIDLDVSGEDAKDSEKSAEKEVDEGNEKESMSIKTTPKSKPKKSEDKIGVKTGALTRFFTKTENKEKGDSKEAKSAADSSPKCDLVNGHNDATSSGGKKEESKHSESQVSESEKSEKSEKIEEQMSPGKSESEKEDSKDSLSSSKATSKADSDKDENSRSEQDPQDMDVSKIESDTESSGDEVATDQRTDNDEAEDRKKSADGKSLTPVTKKERDLARQKKMTPKQLEKKIERQKRREERQNQRLEREKKKEEERQMRKKEKEEKRKEKEEKDKAERELRKKEKEQKELKKQMEIEQKQKEKEAKEEDRRKREEAKEEEKRRKEEEKLEAERKKQKAASTFASFFVAKKPTESKIVTEQKDTLVSKNFMPFEVKADMRVAPICRRNMSEDQKLKFDEARVKQSVDKSKLYVEEIRSKLVTKRKSGKTWPFELKDDEDDVVIIDNEGDLSQNCVDRGNLAVEKHRAKLLMFNENRRPPYRGTWRKKSSLINPRKPFVKDTKCFDYEIDSDEEWEEEEPGESLRGSDDEKDEENPEDNEYDVDNEFMVPHGYLSEEEAPGDEDEEDTNPETQKLKIKLLGEQFEAEMKTKTSKLKPKVIGCIWRNSDSSYASNIHPQVLQFLKDREAWVREIPVVLQTTGDNDSPHGSDCGTPSRRLSSIGPGAKKTRVPEEAMPDLIRLIHGNINGRGFLVKEFMSFWSNRNELRVSKVSLSKKIREIARWAACTEEGPMFQKTCWYVSEEVRKKYLGNEDCGLPNRWNYILIPKRKFEVPPEVPEKLEKEEKDKEKEKEKKSVPLITQFTKKITQEEMKKQLTEKSAAKATPTLSSSKPGKRVALISVGRGEQFPKSSRVSLLDKFVTGEGPSLNKEVVKSQVDRDDDDDVMIIEDGDEKVELDSETKGKCVTERGDSENVDIKSVESEDDGIMIIEDTEDAEYPGEDGKETRVEKTEENLKVDDLAAGGKSEGNSEKDPKGDESKMETTDEAKE